MKTKEQEITRRMLDLYGKFENRKKTWSHNTKKSSMKKKTNDKYIYYTYLEHFVLACRYSRVHTPLLFI